MIPTAGFPRRRTPTRLLVLLSAVLAAWPRPGAAQSVRYLPVNSWIQPTVEYLVRAGVLRGLDPLTRPFHRRDVARAVADADTSDLGANVRAMVRLVAAEVTDDSTRSDVRWTADVHAGFLGASDASRWTLRPSKDSTAAYPQAGAEISLELPHLALVTSPAIDNRLRGDPWYAGKKDRFVAGRDEGGYLLASWRHTEIFFGSTDRNWGPPELEGLLISPSPYAREHFFVRLGVPRLHLELLASQLDTITPWTGGPAPDRWLIAHRLVLEPSDRLALSFDESLIYAGSGLPWRYFNPVTAGLLTEWNNKTQPVNSLLGASAVWRAHGQTRLFTQVLLDDIQIDRKAASDREPPGYGYTVGASGAMRHAAATWTAFYTRVLNLTYRTPRNEEQYTVDGVGIGRNFSDYDQLTARFEMPLPRSVTLGAEATWLRQGAGDMRRQYPSVAQYADSLTFLTGVVERQATAALTVRWSPRRAYGFSTYLGYNALRNARNVAGVTDHRWVWRIEGTIRRRFGGGLD